MTNNPSQTILIYMKKKIANIRASRCYKDAFQKKKKKLGYHYDQIMLNLRIHRRHWIHRHPSDTQTQFNTKSQKAALGTTKHQTITINEKKKGGKRWTSLHRSQVKGRKSMSLQSSTLQCFPRSGNSGVPMKSRTIKIKLKRENNELMPSSKFTNPNRRSRRRRRRISPGFQPRETGSFYKKKDIVTAWKEKYI